MKILKYLLFLLLISVIALAMYASIQPSEYSFTRTAQLSAPPLLVSDFLSTPNAWHTWNPWMQNDSTQSVQYSRDSLFTASWGGNQLTTNRNADTLIQVFKGKASFPNSWRTKWIITSGVSHTILTAEVTGKLSFFEKLRVLWKGQPKDLLSANYEESLHELNAVLSAHQNKYQVEHQGLVELSGKYYVYKLSEAPVSKMYQTLATLYEEVYDEMKRQEVYASGKPFALFSGWDDSEDVVTVHACVPVSSRCELTNDLGIRCDYLSEGFYYKTVLKGDHSYLETAWDDMEKSIIKESITKDPERPTMEVYIVDGSDTYDVSKYITELYFPVLPEVRASFGP